MKGKHWKHNQHTTRIREYLTEDEVRELVLKKEQEEKEEDKKDEMQGTTEKVPEVRSVQ